MVYPVTMLFEQILRTTWLERAGKLGPIAGRRFRRDPMRQSSNYRAELGGVRLVDREPRARRDPEGSMRVSVVGAA
jgi:hypothetical protein